MTETLKQSKPSTREYDTIIETELKDIGMYEFSTEALYEMREKAKEYCRNISLEAKKIAELHETDVISAIDVRRASENLLFRPKKNSLSKSIYALGGILLGSSIQEIYHYYVTGQLSINMIIVILLGSLGVFIISVFTKKD